MTQDELAEKLGKSKKQVISNWENGKNEPKLSELVEIAQLFNTTSGYLIDGDENISKEKYEELQAKYIALLESRQGGGGSDNRNSNIGGVATKIETINQQNIKK